MSNRSKQGGSDKQVENGNDGSVSKPAIEHCLRAIGVEDRFQWNYDYKRND
jgi:hypothetical protein